MRKLLMLSTLLFVPSFSQALTKSNVYLFKGDKNGTLHMIGQPKDNASTDATVIVGNDGLCGKIQKGKKTPSTPQKDSEDKADPVCRADFSSQYKFSKQHKFTDQELPLALGFDSCSIKPMRDNALMPSPQMIGKFKSDHGLPKYVSERIKVFVGADGAKYLSLIGVKAKTKKSSKPDLYPIEFEGVVKRDFVLFDMQNKKFVLDKRDQVCCDPKNENVYICNIPKVAETPCFEPYAGLERFQGLIADDGKLYSYAVDSSTEGVHGYVWQIENNSQKQIYHESFYALGSCK